MVGFKFARELVLDETHKKRLWLFHLKMTPKASIVTNAHFYSLCNANFSVFQVECPELHQIFHDRLEKWRGVRSRLGTQKSSVLVLPKYDSFAAFLQITFAKTISNPLARPGLLVEIRKNRKIQQI